MSVALPTAVERASTSPGQRKTRVVFVNAGILGMVSFSKYIREAMAEDPEIEAVHINLTENLTLDERIVRRVLCTALWPDGLFGLKNIDLGRLRAEWHAGIQARRRINAVLARGPVDVLHFHRQGTAYASFGLVRRIPTILSIDATQDIMIDDARTALERWSYLPNAALDGRLMKTAAAIESTSYWAAANVRRRYPACRTPIHVMPIPVRLEFFDARWIDERFERATPGYKPVVLFVGGDFIRKGGEDLLAVWREAELFRSARLVLMTDWPLPPIDAPGVSVANGVSSYTPEWSELWRAADILVLPTRQEAFGLAFQEAGAASLPRIGPRIAAVPELIVHGVNGLLIEPGDRARLANALRVLIESRDLRRDLGRAARQHVVGCAAPEAFRDRLRAVILALAGRGPAAPGDVPA